jgi:transcription termination factor Rho
VASAAAGRQILNTYVDQPSEVQMSGEQQLERSVLEGKERDELHAIAEALGTKPGSRAKKADLIDSILRATGVDAGGDAGNGTSEPAKPRRTRTPRAKATAEPTAESVTSPDGQVAVNGAPAAADKGAEPARAESRPEPARAGSPRAGSARAEAMAGAGEEARGAEPRQSAEPGRDTRSAGGGPPPGEGDQAGADQGGSDRAPSADQGRNRFQSNQGPGGFDGEPGNRRNRRRRGRDRERGGERGERDLQGQAADAQYSGEPVPVKGYLDLRDEGYGFLRTSGFLPGPRDVYVSVSQVRKFALRKGDYVEGASRPASPSEKYPALLRVDTISGLNPDDARLRPRFEDLTPLFPDEKLRLEVPGDAANMTARIVDLISPIGKGQRGLIVSPPKAGKTTVLKQIAHSIEANNPEIHLMVLLVDERPEEVTDMRRSVKGEVIASTFDRPSEEHTQVAELAIERAKRMVELGQDVVIVLDGITRLARAYNLAQPATGRIMSGGVDSGALYPPKKFFGSARNIEEGGSLTILATALVETGSRMDEVIFEEFKGTGNMELRLDRKLSERRIYPALDVNASSTRHEELLFDRTQLQQVWKLRRVLNALGSEGSAAAGLELLMDKIKSTRSNDEFLSEIAKGPNPPV